MWMLFARAPPPDAPYWPGRRWLAVIDAVAWPGMTWCVLHGISRSGGLVVALAMTLLVVSGVRRVFTALVENHRYHFTTWRLGRVLAWILATGAILKTALPPI